MQTIKLTEDLRLKLLDLYMAGKVDLSGTETKLIAIAVNVSPRDTIHAKLAMRIVRAKSVWVLGGIEL